MKNLKLNLILFVFCALVTTQTTFAQDDSRVASEAAEMAKAKSNENADIANLKHQELRALRDEYNNASKKDRVAIQEEINALKVSYEKDVKVQEIKNKALANEATVKAVKEKRKYDLSENDEFIKDARKRIKKAKIILMEAENRGELSEEEIKQRLLKIDKIQKRIKDHEASVGVAKVEIAKRNEEIKKLQD